MGYFQVNQNGFQFQVKDSESRLFNIHSVNTDILSLSNPIIRKLLFLVDEEIAKWDETACQVSIPFDSIYLLEREELDLLKLPEFYPYGFGFRVNDRITSSEFKLDLEFKRTDIDLIVNPLVIGSYIRISSSEEYIFEKDSFELIELIAELNQSGCENNQKLVLISRIATSINKINEKVPDQLAVYDLEELENFDLELIEGTDGAISVYPVPLKDGEEGRSKLLNTEEEKEFHKQFSSQQDVRGQYLLRGRKLLVYNDTTKNENGEKTKDDVLRHFKNLQNLKGKEKEAFLKNPETFFPQTIRVDLSEFSDRVKSIGRYVPVVLPFVMQSENDWFPSEGGLIIDGERILLPPESRDELIKLIREGLESEIQSIEFNGRDFHVNEETLEALQKLKKAEKSKTSDSKEKENENIKTDSQNTILIIKDNFFELEQRGSLNKERNGKVSIPESMNSNVKLYRHQEDGIRWLQDLWIKGSNGALLADDMGLGKTIQALLFCAWVKEQKLLMGFKEDEIGPFLIVAPVALLDNWDNEYSKFLNWEIFKEPLKLHGSNLKQFKLENKLGLSNERDLDPEELEIEQYIAEKGGLLIDISEIKKYGLVLTTYETVRDYQFSLSKIDWSVMVLDEIQKVKNPKALATHAVKAMNYNFGLGLTGTPVENSWIDLWTIMDFVQPGHLGTLIDFNDRYEKKLNENDVDKNELGEQLKSEIGNLLRRRFKEDHIDELPNKEIRRIPVELTKYQKEVYSQVLERVADSDNEEHTLTQLAAIRDISLCPYLPFKNENRIENISLDKIVENSSKIWQAFKIIDEIKSKDEKVILFLISRKTQSVLQRLIIEKYGIKAHIINGTVSGGRRQSLVDVFQNVIGFNIIIMSPEAAGVGLNITEANHVIHLSRPWNPAKEDQASDRIYRIGQKKNVTIHIPISTFKELGEGKSFDEILDHLLEEKRNLSRSVLVPAKIDKSDLMTLKKEMLGTDYKTNENTQLKISDIDDLNGVQFELFCSMIYSKLGYSVDMTERSRDKGVDLIVRDIKANNGFLVQCKAKDNPSKRVNQSGIQEVVSGKKYYESQFVGFKFELLVITNSVGFTEGAKSLAEENMVRLISREEIINMVRETKYSWNDHVKVTSSF